MISSKQLQDYLDEYLRCADFDDYAPNGLQVEGKANIARIATAVTASAAVIDQARLQQVDALLVHHGYFWRGENPVICGMKRQRIAHLIKQDMNLFAYHLPLDCHPDIGNNACLAKLLEIGSIKMHTIGRVKQLLWSGRLATPVTPEHFKARIHEQLHRTPLHIRGSDRPIHTLAWCSGGAQDYIEQANELGVDAYISGEISERTYYQAKELGLHYFACGHHATERYGIQALGQHLSEKFGIEHQFIDSENPV